MQINSDFADLLREFNAAGVEYLIVGAHAVARYSRPRSTGDFDVYVGTDSANAERVFKALARFGAPLDDISAHDFTAPDLIYQIGVAPARVDIMTEIDGVDFKAAYSRREIGQLVGLPASFIAKEDLIINKRMTGRPKDLADLLRLEADQ